MTATGQQALAPPPGPARPGYVPATSPAPSPVPAGTPAPPVPTRARRPRTHSTPRTLAVLLAVAIAAVLLLGTVGTWQLAAASRASDAAADNADQLIRIQNIQTALLHADAMATNGFLVGGLEPPQQRDDYDNAIADATSQIAAAASAQPADRAALQQLNVVVSDYVATVATARADNRLGFPVGAEYLRQASLSLRTEAIPILDNLTTANRDRAVTEMGAHGATWLILAGCASLVLLLVCCAWLARLFHRVVNVGLALAVLLAVIALVLGGSTLTTRVTTLDDIKTGSFERTTELARATILGNDAKSFESLTLISRGSGQAYEKQWQGAAAEMAHALADQPSTVRTAWATYVREHQALRKLDDGGKWDEAVAVSVGTGKANVAYQAFESAARTALARASEQTTTQLARSRGGVIPIAVFVALACLGAAVLAGWGLSRRFREYQ